MTFARALLPLLLAPGLGPAAAGPETEQALRAARGRQIYVRGTSPSGAALTAVLGQGVELPGSSVPCAQCHGRDGRGRPEGAVTPSDITWGRLSRADPNEPGGRRHRPYDEAALKRAVALGLDPSGNVLHVAMPRFRLSHGDMQDLVAYLAVLGHEPVPGVGDTSVRIALLLPPPGPWAEMGRAVQSALAARFEELGKSGGLYQRRIELFGLEPPAEPSAWRAWATEALEREKAFAAVAAFPAGADGSLTALFEELEVPLVGPFARNAREDYPPGRYVFHVLPGLESQGRTLARQACASTEPPPVRPAVALPDGAEMEAAARAVEESCPAVDPSLVVRYAPGAPDAAARRLAAANADLVFFLGSGPEALAMLREAAAQGWHPRLLATGAAADGSLFDAPPAFQGRLQLALPAPPELPAETAARYRALAAAHALPADHRAAQLSALAAAEVLIEGLRRAGRDLTRERLVESLESLRVFSTGYGPPATYGPARRLGARGAYLTLVDLARRRLAPAPGWIDEEPLSGRGW